MKSRIVLFLVASDEPNILHKAANDIWYAVATTKTHGTVVSSINSLQFPLSELAELGFKARK